MQRVSKYFKSSSSRKSTKTKSKVNFNTKEDEVDQNCLLHNEDIVTQSESQIDSQLPTGDEIKDHLFGINKSLASFGNKTHYLNPDYLEDSSETSEESQEEEK